MWYSFANMSSILNITEAASLALHATFLMAGEPDRVISNREIAETLNVSDAHLSKVLQRLSRAGIVLAVRGPKGGFRLAGDPDEFTLLNVYEAIEGPLEVQTCLLKVPVCNRCCMMGDLLSSINNQIKNHLAVTKLSDVAGR